MVSELYRPSNCRFSVKLVPTFVDRGCCAVSAVDPYGRNLGFLDRSRYSFFQSRSSVVLTRLSGPRSTPATSQNIWKCQESNLDLCMCSQEPWPLNHRDSLRQGLLIQYYIAASCCTVYIWLLLYFSIQMQLWLVLLSPLIWNVSASLAIFRSTNWFYIVGLLLLWARL
jgi:hypothetical protein